ncbi:MAG: NAD-dependent malic enzyme [Nitrososphaeraceae archaeon]|nr:NAD-dependent malic enzyme [Nitrososphaeraceae archaeon]
MSTHGVTNSVSAHEKGIKLLETSALNKGTAFTDAERAAFGLEGLLPPSVENIDQQERRILQQLGQKPTDLERYIFLIQLFDSNQTLFYHVVMSDPAYFLPILYDPTVGEACLKFGHIYRRPHGMYISMNQKGRVHEILKNWPEKDVRVICATSGGRILGLGDLGANGMGIPIGKLQLYTACAGVPPQGLLPLLLDFGTNNRELLNDPLYLGLRQTRPSIQETEPFVDEFVQAVQESFPNCCIHFEDWKGTEALHYLSRYRDKVCCFNDDIQGTGSVTVAGLENAMRITGESLKDQRVLFLGAGSAGIGIADMIRSAMKLEGLSDDQARSRIWMFDVNGLLENTRKDLIHEQKVYSHNHTPTDDLVAAVDSIKPSILIGVSTIGKAFTQAVVETMSRLNERPIIFALSNPTEHAECTPEEAYRWSGGKAVYAAGVQFPPVYYNSDTFLPGQANNFYVYPAVGLAIYATCPKFVTDEMFIEAAKATADQVTDKQLKMGMLFPPQSNVLDTEVHTAERVVELVFEHSLARVNSQPKDISAWLRAMLYKPEYTAFIH